MSAPLLSVGSRGSAVADLQKRLAAAGFSPGPVDGDFGPRTRNAVEEFQRARGLGVDGIVGAMTQAALQRDSFKPTSAPSGSSVSTVELGSKGPQVATLQEKLQAAGFNPGPVDGDFGPMTRAAVVNYQKQHGLAADGVVGPQTWGSLNGDSFQPGPTGGSTGPGPTQGPTAVGDLPKTGNAFIDSVAAAAVQSQRETGVPASVTLAQAILESGWGKSGLTRQANNYFGIKGTGPAGSVNMPTQEFINGHYVTIDAPFRAYHNAAESFSDHGRFFIDNSRYHNAFQYKNDPEQFARTIAADGYATAPDYASSLIGLMRSYNLEQFDKYA